MSQRIALVTAALMTAACLTVCFLLRSGLQAMQATNQALLEKLDGLSVSAPAGSADSAAWNPLKLKLVFGVPDETLPEGFKITMTGNFYGAGEKTTLDVTSDAGGVIDFGRVRPENYECKVIGTLGRAD